MIEISENFSLKEYNTFGIDVTCKYFVKCDQESELLEFVGSYELDPEEILLLGAAIGLVTLTCAIRLAQYLFPAGV